MGSNSICDILWSSVHHNAQTWYVAIIVDTHSLIGCVIEIVAITQETQKQAKALYNKVMGVHPPVFSPSPQSQPHTQSPTQAQEDNAQPSNM